ncbi:HD-GYP domain-containing protein [Comamonadaceae bacterium PP-2]
MDTVAVAVGIGPEWCVPGREATSMQSTVELLFQRLRTHHPSSADHCLRVAGLSRAIARRLSLTAQDRSILFRAALLHDIGKILVPTEILDFPGPLNAEQRSIVKRHSEFGQRLLLDEAPELSQAIGPIVRAHHEWFDGSGYPDGLAQDRIPWLARILCVVDYYDAVTSARGYRAALSDDGAMGLIRSESGKKLDPHAVSALQAMPRSCGCPFRRGVP